MVRRPGLEALSHDFIRTARAKSLNEHTVVIRHTLRNALTPIATIVGLQFGGLLSGTFNIEAVFGYPGVGQLAVNARLMRGQIMSLNRKEYVESARAIGASNGRILFRHLLPNALSPLIVLASLGVADAILAAVALSFTGRGAQPPTPE
jgi:ABC-type dipeptide/oligopeptide/nickel transport system permease component